MIAAFRLDLSQDPLRVTYLLRGARTVLGDVNVRSPDLQSRMLDILADARRLHVAPPLSEIVLPRSHMRYESFRWVQGRFPSLNDVKENLSDLRELELDQLFYDFALTEGAAHVALVERRTLAEAVKFAREYDFIPVQLTASPRKADFPRTPVFPFCAAMA